MHSKYGSVPDRGEPVEIYNSYRAAVSDLPKWANALEKMKLPDPYTVRVHVHWVGRNKFYGIFAEKVRTRNNPKN